MEREAALRLMLSRKKRTLPAAPDWEADPGRPDEVRAALFRHLLLRLNVTQDGLALVSGVPRARVLALCGHVGPTHAAWSDVPAGQLEAIQNALQFVEPDLDLREELHLKAVS